LHRQPLPAGCILKPGPVIEIGGEDSKLIILEKDPSRQSFRLVDFEMNSICAAGTGSFLDQQARRIVFQLKRNSESCRLNQSIRPESQVRCSVFAKSDMIHHQQIATPLHDIVAGLCFAWQEISEVMLPEARKLKTCYFLRRCCCKYRDDKSFQEVLNLTKDELIIPAIMLQWELSVQLCMHIQQAGDESFPRS